MEANHYMSPPCAYGKVLRIALNLVEITKESPPTTGASYGIPYTCFQPETSGFWPPKLFSRLLGFEQVGVGFTFPCLRRLRGALLFDLEFDFFTTVFPVLPSSRELFLVFSRPFFGFFFIFFSQIHGPERTDFFLSSYSKSVVWTGRDCDPMGQDQFPRSQNPEVQ